MARMKTHKPPPPPASKSGLHPRSRHRERYDFPALVRSCPELGRFLAVNAHGDTSIPFADPEAVKALNRALLLHVYGVRGWDIPPGYLCPPIPGRADYLHYLADLLACDNGGTIPRGPSIRALDIGVGANCIYPLIGHHEYGWRFLGSELDPAALANAARILDANPGLSDAIQLRRQFSPARIFGGILEDGETFDVCLCNPPFHASLQEAQEGSQRKWRNLGRDSGAPKPVLNFGGRGRELCCEGGEEAFLRRMIEESAGIPERCLWFTALVSKSSSLPGLRKALGQAQVADSRTLEMAQGQKRSRILAWTFLDSGKREAWRLGRKA